MYVIGLACRAEAGWIAKGAARRPLLGRLCLIAFGQLVRHLSMQPLRRIPPQSPQGDVSDDNILRQITAAVGKSEGFCIIRYRTARPVIAACADKSIGDICAIAACVHFERPAHCSRDGAQKGQIKPGLCRFARNMAVQSRGPAMDHVTIRFNRVKTAAQTDHHRPQPTVSHDQV